MPFRISQYLAFQNIVQVVLGLLMIGFVQWHLFKVIEYGDAIDDDQQTLLLLQKYGGTMSNVLLVSDLVLSGGNTYLIKIVYDNVDQSNRLIASLQQTSIYPNDFQSVSPESDYQIIAETVRAFTTVRHSTADRLDGIGILPKGEQKAYDEATERLVEHFDSMQEQMAEAATARKAHQKSLWNRFFLLTSVTVLGLLVVIFFSWLMQTRTLARPIMKLTENAERAINSGVFASEAIDIEEMDQLRDNFEKLVAQLKREQRVVEARSQDLSNTNSLLQDSLDEKLVLLKEIHHRVKNNLQIISSMLSLQAIEMQGERDRQLFINSQNRVQTMALIHERLYQSDDMSQVDFSEYIPSLAENIFSSYKTTDQDIELSIDIGNVKLELDQAIPCGLMINEMVTNSLKYAFPNGESGKIRIALSLTEDECVVLEVSDDGVGLPAEVDVNKQSSKLGLQLIRILTRQLRGTVEMNGAQRGTHYVITFPLEMESVAKRLV